MTKSGLVEVDVDEYAVYASKLPGYNFLQSANVGQRRLEDGWQIHYLLYYRDGDVVGAASLNGWRYPLGLIEFDCAQGPLADYDSDDFTDLLREIGVFARQQGGVSLLINPPILASHRNGAAEIVDNYSGDSYKKRIEACGYRHIPNTIADQNELWLRWYFVKDMTPYGSFDEVLKSVDSQTRWSLNKARRFGIVVRPAETEAERQAVVDLHLATGERRGFKARNAHYYEGAMRVFPENQRFLVGAYLDVEAYASNLKSEQSALKNELDEAINSDASVGQQNDIKQRIAGNQKKQAEIDDLRAQATGGQILVAGSFFFHVGDELIYMTSSSDERYKAFYGPYAIQEWALTYAIKHQIPRYNFYGTKGSYMGADDHEGVYQFKRGFGGVIEEQIGYFQLNTRPLMAKLLQAVKRLRK